MAISLEELLARLSRDAGIPEAELQLGLDQLLEELPPGKVELGRLRLAVGSLAEKGSRWQKLVALLEPKLDALDGPLGFLGMAAINRELAELRARR